VIVEDDDEDPLSDDVIIPAAICNVVMEDWNFSFEKNVISSGNLYE
jgi:hypothetical protein